MVPAGCGTSLPYMQSRTALQQLDETGAGRIKHIVYVVQENRSFDNLFHGYPHANTVDYGFTTTGKKVALQPVSLKANYTIDHSIVAMIEACNGTGSLAGTQCRMNGFNKELTYNGPHRIKYPQYVYVPYSDAKPYFDMAHEGVLADDMFQSQLDESFAAHQYIIAAQAAWSVDLPYSYWGCQGGPDDKVPTVSPQRGYGKYEVACFDYTTLGDELDRANLTWRFYASNYGTISSGMGGTWSSYQAVKHIYYGPDWKKDVISPNWRFIKDVQDGHLANFTWVTPVCRDSDHVDCAGGYGPSWVAALVNAVGHSKFWDSTAIFIQWDDWGGLYDHVAPPPPYYRDSLGFRVPLIIMSPYAKHDYVSHVQYETASVLRFAEDLWGLDRLADADRRSNSPARDCFDFQQKPRAYVDIHAPLPPKYFMHQFGDDYFAPDYE